MHILHGQLSAWTAWPGNGTWTRVLGAANHDIWTSCRHGHEALDLLRPGQTINYKEKNGHGINGQLEALDDIRASQLGAC